MRENIEKTLDLFVHQWALVTAGSLDNYNTMTIGWGGLGTIWNKKVATVYVKPCRYTYEFLEANDYFTVSFYDESYKKDLGILGSLSGRDGDKVSKTSLTAQAVENSVTFKEAKVTLLCKKLYAQDLDVQLMEEQFVNKYYTQEAPHRMYIGEVLKVL